MKTLKDILRDFDQPGIKYDDNEVREAISRIDTKRLSDTERTIVEYERDSFIFIDIYGENPIGVTPKNGFVEYWCQRMEECHHPILRSKYCELIWIFKDFLKEKKLIAAASKALIEDAICISKGELYPDFFERERKLVFALRVAILTKDSESITALKNECMDPKNLSGSLKISNFLLVSPKMNLENSETKMILDLLKARLHSPKNHSEATRVLEILIAHYNTIENRSETIKLFTIYLDWLISDCINKDPLLATIRLTEAINLGRNSGVPETNLMNTINLLRDIGPKSFASMGRMSAEVPFNLSYQESIFNEVINSDSMACIDFLVCNFIPKKSSIAMAETFIQNNHPLLSTVNLTIFGENGIPNSTGDKAPNMGRMLASGEVTLIRFLMRIFMKKAIDAKKITPEYLDQFLSKSGLFSPKHTKQVSRGIKAYFEHDEIAAICILIPLLEDAIRKLAIKLGVPALKCNRYDGFDEKSLGGLLSEDPIINKLGEDIIEHLNNILLLRNSISHGLSDDSIFTMENADLVIHSLLIVSKLELE